MPDAGRGRSGCALASGLLLIALGLLLLAQNLTELRLVDYAGEALELFARYWPLALIVWGAYKIYGRFAHPERSRVSALEVLTLLLLVATGFAVGAARHAMERLRASEVGAELAAVLGPGVLGPTHRFREEGLFALDENAPLVVENRFGGVRAVGSERSDLKVVVDKRVHLPSEDEARGVASRLRLEVEGNTARVVGEERGGIEADVEIELPRGTRLVARAPAGRVSVLGLDAAVEIEAGDEDVAVERLGSTLRVETIHGDIRIDGVSGDVTAESRHGSLRARRLGGGLRVQTARGAITAEDVEGAVVLGNRYGSIRVVRVVGPVEVDATHTSVEIEKASGTVRVVSGDRPIFIRDVGGSLTVEARNARLEVREVRGDVTIDSRLQPIRVTDVEGGLTVRSSNGTVVAERLTGPVDIEATSEDVHVTHFESSLSMRSEHGSLFATTRALGGDIALRTTYGDIELALPDDASLRLEARSEDGEVASSLAALTLSESVDNGVRTFRGEAAGARYGARLETDYGDIRLRRGAP